MARIPKVVLLIDEGRGPGRQYLRGIMDYARINGPWVFFAAPPFYIENAADKKQRLESMAKWGANGIITLDVEDLPSLESLGIPIIISRAILFKEFSYPVVDADHEAIGKMASDYFIQKGFRNFAYCGLKMFPWSIYRGKSFDKNNKKAGFATHFFHMQPNERKLCWDEQYKELSDWLKSLPKPAAVFACNDDRGRQVLDACRVSGIKVPEQVAVLGVDNDTLVCNMSFYQLSSIEINLTKAGFEAAETLDKLMAGRKKVKKQIIADAVSVITRQSTDIAAISDQEVAAAVHYIRQNAKSNVQIRDICETLCIAEKTLYNKFIDSLGCSVHEIIVKTRVEEISKVLLETNMSISKVAALFNFSSPKHISRYFSKQAGISPLEYRQKHQHKPYND